MKKNIKEIVSEQFDFLIKDFKFQLLSFTESNGGLCARFINEYCGVCIKYEFREAFVFITLHQVVEGKIAENQRPFTSDSKINAIPLDDVLAIKNPAAMIKPAYAYGANSEYYDKEHGLELYVSRFSHNLREYAADVLTGDLEIFSKIAPVIRRRFEYENKSK